MNVCVSPSLCSYRVFWELSRPTNNAPQSSGILVPQYKVMLNQVWSQGSFQRCLFASMWTHNVSCTVVKDFPSVRGWCFEEGGNSRLCSIKYIYFQLAIVSCRCRENTNFQAVKWVINLCMNYTGTVYNALSVLASRPDACHSVCQPSFVWVKFGVFVGYNNAHAQALQSGCMHLVLCGYSYLTPHRSSNLLESQGYFPIQESFGFISFAQSAVPTLHQPVCFLHSVITCYKVLCIVMAK